MNRRHNSITLDPSSTTGKKQNKTKHKTVHQVQTRTRYVPRNATSGGGGAHTWHACNASNTNWQDVTSLLLFCRHEPKFCLSMSQGSTSGCWNDCDAWHTHTLGGTKGNRVVTSLLLSYTARESEQRKAAGGTPWPQCGIQLRTATNGPRDTARTVGVLLSTTDPPSKPSVYTAWGIPGMHR